MDQTSLRRHDINKVHGHHAFGITEKVFYAYSINNIFTVEF